ncbi:hypothetical protein TcWFU_001901 [Taenia crassiceps]|uniref:Uncharacterized protein n=1 Tax=Taenia crassiceps TaxID=6207 RepID=A0ABR4QBA1_9CEST
MELYKALPDLSSQEIIDKFESGLRHLLRPESHAYEIEATGLACRQVRAPKRHRRVEEGEQRQQHIVAHIIRWMRFRAPTEHFPKLPQTTRVYISHQRLITLKDSLQLDRYLRSSSLEVLLIEEAGSYLGMTEIPLLGLAKSDAPVDETSQFHQRSSKSTSHTAILGVLSPNGQCKILGTMH